MDKKKKVKDCRMVLRIDRETKETLDQAAAEIGISTASLVRATIKELLQNGNTILLLPENLRPPYDVQIARREQSLAAIREELRQRRYRQSRKYASKPLPKRSF
jgi:antitoxin component of RelBE/YafQ-DinJ toxin-antitoxin module